MATATRLVFTRKLQKLAYLPALEIQNALAKRHLNELRTKGTSDERNVLLFYEHYPVFTIGIRKKSVDLIEKERLESLGAEFHYTNRGGLLTFHGPGQLVCYPVLNLACFKKSLKWYVSSLERTLVETCKRFNVEANTTCDTGVWVKDKKIAAIGGDSLES
ncbi:PREDICTED: putative lipoyltransferase 2, mitochondrial [Acropora digitifera]|uniref:putative lipoyltransferase 2, mitochondrial n=1 Tax=Acropora digitifera TaxID=70779 RepID=UPI00077AB9B4|nr:PREDICTED: putative lipoyltransferase 2, mitochondrial [Acropora digitifera]